LFHNVLIPAKAPRVFSETIRSKAAEGLFVAFVGWMRVGWRYGSGHMAGVMNLGGEAVGALIWWFGI
jgi:hypothetical protein